MSKKRTSPRRQLRIAKEKIGVYETTVQEQQLRLEYLERNCNLFRSAWMEQVEQSRTKDETIANLIEVVGSLREQLHANR